MKHLALCLILPLAFVACEGKSPTEPAPAPTATPIVYPTRTPTPTPSHVSRAIRMTVVDAAAPAVPLPGSMIYATSTTVVWIPNNGPVNWTLTAPSGVFAGMLPDATWTVRVTSPGYVDLFTTITTGPDATDFTFRLIVIPPPTPTPTPTPTPVPTLTPTRTPTPIWVGPGH